MYRYLIFVFLVSCSSNFFNKKQPESAKLDNGAIKNDNYSNEVKSWADSYYEDTVLIVDRPLIKETSKEVFNICQGKDIPYVKGYDNQSLSSIKFKRKPITIYTRDGFKKSTYITKGICREIALLKSQLKDNEKSFRKEIKEIKIHYIYNGDSFATEMTLFTQFKSVDFTVR